jgi:hypothetical protein
MGRLLLACLATVLLAAPGTAKSPEQVRVSIEFRQSGTEARHEVQGSTRIVITDPGGTSSRTRLGAEARRPV